jgi:GTP-binding protein
MSKFIDEATLSVSSGNGGNGLIAWRRAKYEPMGGPAGGDGGKGGNVYIEATRNLNTLLEFRFKRKFEATHGARGGTSSRHGASGEHITIMVPLGTVIRDVADDKIIADLTEDGEKILVAEGGRGGRGNAAMASPTRRAPHFCEPGERGVTRTIKLELKLLADVGLVGMPNAGKSTVLSVMSAAKPKIADYPFSTLEPILGVVRNSSGDGYVMADIPGLIEGASAGVGLGHDFLKHIERTKLIAHIVDASDENLKSNIQTIEEELAKFNESLVQKPQIIVLNKIDLFDAQELEKLMQEIKQFRSGTNVISISAATKSNLRELEQAIASQLQKLSEEPVPIKEQYDDQKAFDHQDDGFSITRRKKVIYVDGDRLAKLAEVTDARSPESIHHFHQILRSMGVMDGLTKEKIKPGDEVIIGPLSFTFGENLF